MHPRGPPVGESSLAMFAIDETAIFEIAEREPNCNTTDVKAPTELMFARDGKRCLLVLTQDFLRNRSDKAGSGSGRTL